MFVKVRQTKRMLMPEHEHKHISHHKKSEFAA